MAGVTAVVSADCGVVVLGGAIASWGVALSPVLGVTVLAVDTAACATAGCCSVAPLKFANASISRARESTNRSIRVSILLLPWDFCIVDVVSPIRASAIDDNVASVVFFDAAVTSADTIALVANVCVGRVEEIDVVIL
jgi:hypothetical protein